MIRRSAGFFLVTLGFAAAASAQPVADRVPADAMLYVGWAGTEALAPAYAGSKLKQFVDASPWPEAFPKLVDSLIANATKDDAAKAGDAKIALQFAELMAKHPTAFFLGHIDPTAPAGSPPGPQPHLGLLCDAGADHDVIFAMLKHIADDSKKDPDMHGTAVTDGTLVGIVFGYGADDKVIAEAGKGLASTPGFKIAADEKAAVVVYANIEAGLANIDDAVKANAPPEAYDMWQKGRDASGLAGVKRLAMISGFEGPDWKTTTLLEAPAPRTGLIKLLEGGPMDPALLKRVPADALNVQLGQFDLAAFVTTVHDVVTQVNPQAGDMVNKGLAAVAVTLSRRLDTELFASLGTQWLVFNQTGATATPYSGLTLVNHPRDVKLASAAWTDATFALSNLLPSLLQRGRVQLGFESDDKSLPGENMYVFTLSNTPLTPCWVMHNGFMYVGVDRKAVAAAAKTADGANFVDRPEFLSATKGLGEGTPTSFTWSNLPALAPLAADAIPQGWASIVKLAQQQGIVLPDSPLPEKEKLIACLSPAASVGWTDEAGFHMAARSPFPLSTGLDMSQGGNAALGTTAMGTAILLPSLNRARETANRVKAASDLRQIGLACMLYSNDHKGEAPPDLGTLILQEDLTPMVFLSPSSSTSIPPNVADGTPADKASWANDHSDYVYIKPAGKISELPAETPVCYEKIGIHGNDGVNILFGDGHVEFQRMVNATTMIQSASGGPAVKYTPEK